MAKIRSEHPTPVLSENAREVDAAWAAIKRNREFIGRGTFTLQKAQQTSFAQRLFRRQPAVVDTSEADNEVIKKAKYLALHDDLKDRERLTEGGNSLMVAKSLGRIVEATIQYPDADVRQSTGIDGISIIGVGASMNKTLDNFCERGLSLREDGLTADLSTIDGTATIYFTEEFTSLAINGILQQVTEAAVARRRQFGR